MDENRLTIELREFRVSDSQECAVGIRGSGMDRDPFLSDTDAESHAKVRSTLHSVKYIALSS